MDTTVQKIASAEDTTAVYKSYADEFKNRGELINAIADFQKKATSTEQRIRKERLEVQKLHIKIDNINERIKAVKREKEDLKKKKKELSREK